MISALRLNYALLLAAFALAAVSGLTAALDPWPSVASLAGLFWVHKRITTKKTRIDAHDDRWIAGHVHAQQRTILLCLIGGVVTSLLWALSVKQFGLRTNLLVLLQVASGPIFWLALAHPIVGLALTYWRPKRAGAAVAADTPP